jgi:putative ABC transport system ATP-binding protein
MTAVLELAGVSRTYGEGAAQVRALVDIDLTVVEGELVAVMGPSGSGKSTLLTIAGTLDDASEGTVTIDGIDVARLSRNGRAQLRRRSIGYVFQDFNLLAGLTVAENVSLPLELDGVGLRAARAAARAALEPLCRAVSASGRRSPGRWWATGACCLPTSPPAPSTRSTART